MAALPDLPPSDAQPPVTGRRGSARLRLAIPARFVSVYSTQDCLLLDVSRTGARLALGVPLAVGQSGFIALGRFEVFGTIIRLERESGGGVNAMVFDDPLPKADVLEIRRFAEQFETREQASVIEAARRWVTGRL